MATVLTTTGVRFAADACTAEELKAKATKAIEASEGEDLHLCWLLLDDKGSMVRLDQVAAILA